MRVLLVAILIALLPLRSWAGDMMAIQMAGVATTATREAEPDHADCMEHASSVSDKQPAGESAAPDGHCKTCSACQVCSSVALAAPATQTLLESQPHSLPRWVAARFASADRALGQKPPIS